MCNKAVREDPFSPGYVPDWFVIQVQVKKWYDYDYFYDDEPIEWYYDYQQRKAEKEQINEELVPIAWLPSRL